MFTPSQNDVRRFYRELHRKIRERLPLTAMEAAAAPWVDAHPEYAADLSDLDAALACVYDVESGRTNPFLHLSMHLSISEQVSIDQPRGIRQAVELLAARRGSAHEAQHEVMECLGEMLWASQRSGLPPDGQAYLDSVRRRATRDAPAGTTPHASARDTPALAQIIRPTIYREPRVLSTTEQTILDIIAKEGAIDRASILPESTMQDLGVHSLDAVQIIFEIEDHFDISVPEQEANYATGTVRQLVEGVDRLIAAKGDAPT